MESLKIVHTRYAAEKTSFLILFQKLIWPRHRTVHEISEEQIMKHQTRKWLYDGGRMSRSLPIRGIARRITSGYVSPHCLITLRLFCSTKDSFMDEQINSQHCNELLRINHAGTCVAAKIYTARKTAVLYIICPTKREKSYIYLGESLARRNDVPIDIIYSSSSSSSSSYRNHQ